ncbi:unnamed protein product [Diplocarpon coronariae]
MASGTSTTNSTIPARAYSPFTSPSAPTNFGRGGYNKGPDDDEEEDGRGGYN